jgi:hypothetical protein
VDIVSASGQFAMFRIFTTNGVSIGTSQAKIEAGANRVPVSLPMMAQGMYLLEVRTQDGVSRTLKFLKE